MKIILAGSPPIALPAFEILAQAHKILAVVTRPNQRQGRGLKWQATPVANWAAKHHIKVFKPFKISDIYADLKALDFDVLITFAYGQILPKPILQLGRLKPLNIHGSLLPKYRGAAPIHHALLNGDRQIGISLIEMVEQMDAGSIYFQASKPISKFTNYDQAAVIIANLARTHINLWLQKIAARQVKPQPQSQNFSTAPKIAKFQACITPETTVAKAKRMIRAFTSVPGAFTIINGVRYKLFDYTNSAIEGCLKLRLGDGLLFVCDFQPANKNRIRLVTPKSRS